MKSQVKFKNVVKALMLLVALVFFAAVVNAQDKPKGKPWAAPETAAKVKSPVASNSDNIAEGKALYAKHCKSCHGTKGKGDGPKSANLDISCGDFTSPEFKKETDGTIYWKTMEGRDPMPSFKKKLSSDECWKIIAHLRTLE